jgi:hypothetical protein
MKLTQASATVLIYSLRKIALKFFKAGFKSCIGIQVIASNQFQPILMHQ